MLRASFAGLLLLLGACTAPITTPPQPMPAVASPIVEVPVMQPVAWRVLVTGDETNFALDEGGYRALSGNLIEIRRYAEELQAVVTYQRAIISARSE